MPDFFLSINNAKFLVSGHKDFLGHTLVQNNWQSQGRVSYEYNRYNGQWHSNVHVNELVPHGQINIRIQFKSWSVIRCPFTWVKSTLDIAHTLSIINNEKGMSPTNEL